jgi:hypothetical protein
MNRRARSAWIAGLAVGAAGGFLALELPTVGYVLLLLFAFPAAIVGPRAAAIGGLLTGFGGVWLLLLGRVALECRAPDGEIGCSAPGIEPWLAFGAAVIAIGIALTIVAVRARAAED